MRDYDKPILDNNNEPLKVGQIASHHCIRVIKQSRALQKLGYTLYGAGDKVSYGTPLYDAYFVYQNIKQIKETVRTMVERGCKILTYANEPDWPVPIIRETLREMNREDVKIICDLHDLDSIRDPGHRDLMPKVERKMFNATDGIIYVSLPIQEITNELHQITKPNICLYSYCNKGIVEYDDTQKRNGIVYEGGANPPNDEQQNKMFPYRDLYNIIKKLVEQGNEVTMFCGNLTAYTSYYTAGAVLFPPTDYDEMMKELINYKYGICVFNNKNKTENQVNLTLTNKEHEYIQAGLPVLACWCEETEKHVNKWKTGFTFNNIEEIGDCSHLNYEEVKQNVDKVREQLVMENFIVRLENLYAELLGLEKKGMPNDIYELNTFEYGKQSTDRLLS